MFLLKLIYRFVKCLAVLLLIEIPMQLIGMVVLAVVLLFVSKTSEILPKAFRWFDNYSGVTLGYPLGDGLAGDPRYREARRAAGHKNVFWERYVWLAIRNPVNYFTYAVTGHKLGKVLKVSDFAGNPETGDTRVGGFYYLQITDILGFKLIALGPHGPVERVLDAVDLYEYYFVKPYSLRGVKRCLYVRFGFKLASLAHASSKVHVQRVFNFAPFKTFSGVL